MNSKLVPVPKGINLYLQYTDKPFPEAETILFLHGYPDTHKTWDKQIDFFKKNYRVAVTDLRGAGLSSAPMDSSGYRIESILSDFDSIIEELVGKEEKIHLVGHDWGSVLFWSYLSYPERQRKVKSFSAVACPHPSLFFKNTFGKLASFQPQKIWEGINQMKKSYYILFFQIPMLPEFLWQTFTEEIWKFVMQNSGLSENDKMHFLTRDEVVAATVNNINLYRQALQHGVQELPKSPLSLPVALFIPEDDAMISPEVYEDSETVASKLRVFRVQANHWVHRERPDWFNQNLFEFIRNTSAI